MGFKQDYQQYRTMAKQGWFADLAEKERLLTPLLFAITVLLLFNFVFDDLGADYSKQIFVAEVYLTSLLALQMSYARSFFSEQQDKVFQIFKSSSISMNAWFLAKLSLAILNSFLVYAPVMLLCSLFFSGYGIDIWAFELWVVGLLSLFGFATLGTLLSVLTLNASGREMLFPILYFPLAIPVLLAATQASLIFLTTGDSAAWTWIGLLAGFDLIYFTLGLMLFGELVAVS